MMEAVNIYSEKYGDASNDKSPVEEEDYDLSDPGTLARKPVFFLANLPECFFLLPPVCIDPS